MAKKARKKPAAKAKKKSKPAARKKTRAVSKKRKARKTKPGSLSDRVSSAYRTVVDTVKGTDKLRNKMEPPGTSESE